MRRRIWRDIEIQGQVFPTLQAAAAHFGCTPENVARAIKSSRTHRLGCGRQKIEPCPVRIRGVVYGSAREAAVALGLSPSAIWQALAQNRIDTVGLGPRCPNPHRSRPFTVGMITWSSMRAADKDLGFADGYISLTFRRNYRRSKERIIAAAMAFAARIEAGAPIPPTITLNQSTSSPDQAGRAGQTWTRMKAA